MVLKETALPTQQYVLAMCSRSSPLSLAFNHRRYHCYRASKTYTMYMHACNKEDML